VQHSGFNATDNASVLSGMDIDEASSIATERAFARSNGETTFAKSVELTVSLYAHLPVELKQTLRSAGMYDIQLIDASFDSDCSMKTFMRIRTPEK
jgi:hypothetical protein